MHLGQVNQGLIFQRPFGGLSYQPENPRTRETFGVINRRAWSLRATRDWSNLFLPPVDIAMIELTIGFVHSVWYLPNALMPLSSLAAEPARITIPNEPPRGGRV